LSGFQDIHLIDLDTIDVSNLNRQFLFRTHHVGKPKAIVAREIALSFNPNVKITAHHGNIKSSQFGIDYFEQFALVMNALDNVDARKHVNRLCLATKTPLIESGTTGYLGQVSVIQKGETECYECTEKVTQKVYPICTIRSTPDKMVHCIVWAKHCYQLLFGKMEDSMLWEEEDKSAFMHLIRRQENQFNYDDVSNVLTYAQNVFQGLFEYEIIKKLEMKVYKTTTSKIPKPLLLSELVDTKNLLQNHLQNPKLSVKINSKSTTTTTTNWNDRDVWTISECAYRFLSCIARMLLSMESRKHLGNYEFDKDDVIAMEFVTSAANLRAAVFNIQMESLYSCKGIAGNIIPAIATTNAIIAGIQVLEAYKIIQATLGKEKGNASSIAETCKYTYCNRVWDARGVFLNAIALPKPNPSCYVCSKQIIKLAIDTQKTTLEEFITKVLKKHLGVNEPTISIGSSTIYEEGEDAEESLAINLSKRLCNLPGKGVHHDTILSIEDFSQDFTCSIRILHRSKEDFGEKAIDHFAIGGEIEKLQQAMDQAKEKAAKQQQDQEKDDADVEIVLLEEEQQQTPTIRKGKRSIEKVSPKTTTSPRKKQAVLK
jgi:ubiquitin-like 1-activating enzyme E1 B